MIILGGKYILQDFDDDIIIPMSSGTKDAWISIKGEEGNRPVLAGKNNLFAAIIIDGVSYITIENLEITSDDGASFRDGINGAENEISHIILKDLYIHHLDEFGINLANVDGLDSKAENTRIHNSIVANNSCDGIKLWGNGSKVHNSLVYGTGDGVPGSSPWAALVIDTQGQDAYFELINVTIDDTPQTQNYPMYVQYDSSTPITLVMRNSIVANGYGLVFIGDSVNFIADHNVFYRPGQQVQVYANGREYTTQQIEAEELGEGNLSRDPLFVAPAWGETGDYRLMDDSPCIGLGYSILPGSTTATEDIDGII